MGRIRKKMSLVLAFLGFMLNFAVFGTSVIFAEGLGSGDSPGAGLKDCSYVCDFKRLGGTIQISVNIANNSISGRPTFKVGALGLKYDKSKLSFSGIENAANGVVPWKFYNDEANGGIFMIWLNENLGKASPSTSTLIASLNFDTKVGTSISDENVPSSFGELPYESLDVTTNYANLLTDLSVDTGSSVLDSADQVQWQGLLAPGSTDDSYRVVTDFSVDSSGILSSSTTNSIGLRFVVRDFRFRNMHHGNSPAAKANESKGALELISVSTDADGYNMYMLCSVDNSGKPILDGTELYYSSRAWAKTANYDTDTYTVFTNSSSYVDNGYTMSESDSFAVTVKLYDSKNKEIVIDDAGVYKLPSYGVYTVKYHVTYSGGMSEIEETKAVIYLPKLGDIDLSGEVYSDADRAEILNRFNNDYDMDANFFKIYLYRVCDINKDGVVNMLDALETTIIPYYDMAVTS